MKFFSTVIAKGITSFFFLLSINTVAAQTNLFNSNGTVKNSGQYFQEQSAERSRQQAASRQYEKDQADRNRQNNSSTSTRPANETYQEKLLRQRRERGEASSRAYSEAEKIKAREAERKKEEAAKKTAEENNRRETAEAKRWLEEEYLKIANSTYSYVAPSPDVNGYRIVMNENKYGLIDDGVNVIVELIYDGFTDFSNGYYNVKSKGKWGFMDKDGVAMGFKYDKIVSGFDGETAKVVYKGKVILIDKSGNKVLNNKVPVVANKVPAVAKNIKKEYDEETVVSEGIKGVRSKGKIGFVDSRGIEIIPLLYDATTNFHGGLAAVQLNGRWGFIDKKGTVIISIIYNAVEDFKNGTAKVDLNGKVIYFDKAGHEIISVAPELGAIAQNFTQNDIAGKPISLSSFRGKYVLLYFWASWSAHSKIENQNVAANLSRFKNKNFTVLGVSVDEGKSEWLKAIKTENLKWTQVSELQGWNNSVAILYGLKSIPEAYLIDPYGKIVAKDLGGEALGKKLEELLK